ncbi:hypothetical protein [Neisseria animalis]|nr:hypothetical protein [Neisseria animalis]
MVFGKKRALGREWGGKGRLQTGMRPMLRLQEACAEAVQQFADGMGGRSG